MSQDIQDKLEEREKENAKTGTPVITPSSGD
jgi:hypothetical protein